MLAFVIFPLLYSLVAAMPASNSLIYAVGGAEEQMYEMPEYEDPQLALYELAAKGIVPVLTVIDVPIKEDPSSEDGISFYDELAELKKGLVEVIDNLNQALSKIEKGSMKVHAEFDKSLQGLKHLEKVLCTDMSGNISPKHKTYSIITDALKPLKPLTKGAKDFRMLSAYNSISEIQEPETTQQGIVTEAPSREEAQTSETTKVDKTADNPKAVLQKKLTKISLKIA